LDGISAEMAGSGMDIGAAEELPPEVVVPAPVEEAAAVA
jgi:hypothetical protein